MFGLDGHLLSGKNITLIYAKVPLKRSDDGHLLGSKERENGI